MAKTFLDEAIITIYNTGFFDVALPFIITFAVVYGLLHKTKLFGKDKDSLHAMFAVVISLMVIPFALKVDYTTFLSKLIFIIIKIVALAIVLGVLGFKFEKHHRAYVYVAALLLVAGIVVTEFFDIGALKFSVELVYALLILFIFGLMVWLITGPSKASEAVPEDETKGKKKTTEKTPERTRPAMQPVPIDSLSDEQIEEMLERIKQERNR
jgi:hypothetical protein